MKRLNFHYGMKGRKQFQQLKIWHLAALQGGAELTIPLVRHIKGNSSIFFFPVTFFNFVRTQRQNSGIALKYVTK